MKIAIASIVSLLMVISASAQSNTQLAPEEICEMARHSTVYLDGFDPYSQEELTSMARGVDIAHHSFYTVATGFVIGKNRIATAYHVLKYFSNNTAIMTVESSYFGHGKQFKYGRVSVNGIISADSVKDIAIIDAPTGDIPILALEDNESKIGNIVYSYGAPNGIHDSCARGLIVSEHSYYIATTDIADHGSSGGPLIDSFGKIIGVINAGAYDIYEGDSRHITLSIEINELKHLIPFHHELTVYDMQMTTLH